MVNLSLTPANYGQQAPLIDEDYSHFPIPFMCYGKTIITNFADTTVLLVEKSGGIGIYRGK